MLQLIVIGSTLIILFAAIVVIWDKVKRWLFGDGINPRL